MASASITVGGKFATIEADSTKQTLTIDRGARVNIVNAGDVDVFIDMNLDAGNLFRDGLQHDGEIKLEPGDSIPLPDVTTKIQYQCLAAQTSFLWYVPNVR